MRRVLRALALISIAGLCLLAGCRRKPIVREPNGLFPLTLQLDWYPQPEQGGFYAALLHGYYKAEGLDVTIKPGGPFAVPEKQVASGAATFGMGASDAILVAVSRGLPLVAVAATMQKDPQGIMVRADSPVRTFADLNGRSVAVRPGSIWFQYVVQKFKLNNVQETPATLSVANFVQDPNYIQQAFVTAEPYFAHQKGVEGRVILTSDSGYRPYRVYFTSKRFLREHPDIAAAFVRASQRGWKDFLAHPEPIDAAISRLNPALSPDQMAFSVKTLEEGCFITGDAPNDADLGRFTPERWATLYQQLLELKVITYPIDPKTAYTLQFQPQ